MECWTADIRNKLIVKDGHTHTHTHTVKIINVQLCNAFLPFFLNSTTVLIEGQPIKQVEQYKDLGIMVQRDLSWSVQLHISKICAKAYKSLHLIHRTVSSTSPQLRLNLYFSHLFEVNVMYCSQLRRPCLIKDITCLERVQRRTTKFVLQVQANLTQPLPSYVLAWNPRLN